MKIVLKKLNFSQGTWSLRDFSLELLHGSLTAIVGPSGSGKTTILRIIAGLEPPSSGRILFGAQDVTGVPPERRNVGLVFQNDALFTHMDVLSNVSFGPRMKKEIGHARMARRALDLVHLNGFETRSINSLSGGEKKRVAIARALAFKPAALLLDEPFSGLDANLKEKMKSLVLELKEKTGLTIVLVTHDLDDAFFLADRMVVVNNGEVEQEGAPAEIFLKPCTRFVKEFVSDYVVAEGKGGKGFVEAKFRAPAAKPGKVIVGVKKSNIRFDDVPGMQK